MRCRTVGVDEGLVRSRFVGLYNARKRPKGQRMAQFIEHDVSRSQLNYFSLEQVVVAEYITIGAEGERPLLILHMSNGQNYELHGHTAEELANVLREATVCRVSSRQA